MMDTTLDHWRTTSGIGTCNQPRDTQHWPKAGLRDFGGIEMTPLPISFEVHVAARAIAKRAVVQELREAGVRVTLVTPAEINQRATAYIASHPEMIWPLAVERARKMEEMEEARKAARRKRR
jgi:hypothetical protein